MSVSNIIMSFLRNRSFYINLIISFIISLTLMLPMILGKMGYDIFNRGPVTMRSLGQVIPSSFLIRQGVLYFLLVFILMTVNTIKKPAFTLFYKILVSITVTLIFWFIFSIFRPVPPQMNPQGRNPGPEMQSPPPQPSFPDRPEHMFNEHGPAGHGLDIRKMTEFLFIFIITSLIGKVFELVNVKQEIQLENEQLKSENLQNRYDVLLSQINPHFFFNSLNSLASLVRDNRTDNALKYIDELSNTYRYAIQSSGKGLVSVSEELESVKAFCYLLQIRFEEKLFVDIDIEPDAMKMMLPVLSLQPLIENVIKHNVISSGSPLTITITGNREGISVINPVRLRKDIVEKSGTGLANLGTRYKLMTGRDIIIDSGSEIFSVTLPLIKPEAI